MYEYKIQETDWRNPTKHDSDSNWHRGSGKDWVWKGTSAIPVHIWILNHKACITAVKSGSHEYMCSVIILIFKSFPSPFNSLLTPQSHAILLLQSCLTNSRKATGRIKGFVAQLCLTLWPQGLQPARLLCTWAPGKNTGVVCHFLFHKIFLTQGLNPYLL